ncbi:hypothetical protein [Bradyrhizobium sp.]|uniref:hypothetical protein n=1 Tax=Bradyrhizobium sp. TaxID=376 RepID=UPI003C659669
MAVVRKKARSIIRVTDGAGGMMEVKDRRFEAGDWPIKFEIPADEEQADRWSRYLAWGCHRRGWQSSALGQLDRAENSGTITLIENGTSQLEIVWERKRGGPLKVRARLASSTLPLSDAQLFFGEVNDDCRAARTEPRYFRSTLQYDDGMAWRGELWLDDKTRLAPPSLQDETAIIGPRIVHVDAITECIGEPDIISARQKMLLEVSAFLSVVTQRAVRLLDHGRAWVWTADMKSCEVRTLGYLEPTNPLCMPSRGTVKQVPLYPIDDPPQGIDGSINEISFREDIADLWSLYCGLSAERRAQFLQAAAKWQEAVIHWQDRPSLSFTLMAIACEALKPPDDGRNCYAVIEALLGRDAVDRVRQSPFPAQYVRSTHLHTGEFHGSELVLVDFLSSYRDPSFREAHREMFKVTSAAIIEWLRKGGAFQMPTPKNRRKFPKWLKDNIAVAACIIFAAGLGLGLAIGYFR